MDLNWTYHSRTWCTQHLITTTYALRINLFFHVKQPGSTVPLAIYFLSYSSSCELDLCFTEPTARNFIEHWSQLKEETDSVVVMHDKGRKISCKGFFTLIWSFSFYPFQFSHYYAPQNYKQNSIQFFFCWLTFKP